MTTENEPPHPTLPTPNPLRRTQKLGVGSVGCGGCFFVKLLYIRARETAQSSCLLDKNLQKSYKNGGA